MLINLEHCPVEQLLVMEIKSFDKLNFILCFVFLGYTCAMRVSYVFVQINLIARFDRAGESMSFDD